MLDFMKISTRSTKRGVIEIYPKFMIKISSDLMIRGGDFYAIWIEERGLWSTNEQDALDLIDHELDVYVNENKDKFDSHVKVLYICDSENGIIDHWHRYCQKHMRDSFHMLDEQLTYSNSKTNKKDYVSKRLPYPLESGSIESYDKLIGTLYTEEERHKIEWAIGAIVSGESKYIQKFLVLYGAAGTGKSTILNIIQQLFEGYYSVFDAKALGSASNSFALEAFKSNPLVAIQHDGDLSKIEDNTRLNSLVSHELMTVNEKFKSTYANRFKCFLFMGTNKPVKITDAKSGLIRRLIDVSPSGKKLNSIEYREIVNRVKFELGSIAEHCKQVYLDDPHYYDDYIPTSMIGASNDFYNFVLDSYYVFSKEDGTTLKASWEMYKTYCEYARVSFPYPQRAFKEELKNYFEEYYERSILEDGTRVRSYYKGFRKNRFDSSEEKESSKTQKTKSWLQLEQHGVTNVFNVECAECLAQYATETETPSKAWEKVTSILKELDTSKLHYVSLPVNHIVIDFDIPDEDGNKSLEKNLKAAAKWPATYAELSKSGKGVHLHYIYTGDATKLSRIYDDYIEIKVFTGKSSLRRKLSMCNDLPIASISSGLPIKEEKMINKTIVQTQKSLQNKILKAIERDSDGRVINYHGSTAPNVSLIKEFLDQAYDSGMIYDVRALYDAVLNFALGSRHQADQCLKLVGKMHFASEQDPENSSEGDGPLIFYDVEVFPNLFLINWKKEGDGNKVVRMINPTPAQVEELMQHRLVGFNCRRYDNHILYWRLQGATNEQLYQVSQKIIGNDKGVLVREAYNISYTDVYDFASAGNKKSLKKLEIEMGIHHQELGLPWDQPVPEELWEKVAEYCDNDVIATEAAFNYLSADWTARQILADLAGMTVNDTTNSLTTRIIFGGNTKPQSEFCYRNLAEPVTHLTQEQYEFLAEACPKMMEQTHGEAGSLLPYFPGYKYERGVSTYKGKVAGEGGYVEAQPGMHGLVALLDVASMHPHSAIAEILFGVRYTTAFRDIVEGRVSIKHEAWNVVNNMLEGKLTPYIQRVINGEMSSGSLADALKTAINSVYGLTSAKFSNPFKHPDNIDNIVAKRGALFMIDLAEEVTKRGFIVTHVKTDSIKIPDATPEIIEFVMAFGERYGYTFEHEATYDRMCLVNDAVYIAKYADADTCMNLYGYIPDKNRKKGPTWTATGTQFAVPYVFKTLFSKEPIEFKDMCETKSVQSSLYLDINETLPDVTGFEKEYDKMAADFRKGKVSDTIWDMEKARLEPLIAEGHNYQFIGKVGLFCPMQDGVNAGWLMREENGRYKNATGAKGYRWMEAEMVKNLHLEDAIDTRYYKKLVDDAVESLIAYGNYEWFVSDTPYKSPKFVNGVPQYDGFEPFR